MKRNRAFAILLICLFTLTLALAGCGGKDSVQNDTGQGQESQGQEEGQAPEDGDGGGGPEERKPETEAYTYAGGVIRLKGYDVAPDVVNDYEYQIPKGQETDLYTVLDAYNAMYVIPVLESEEIKANRITREDGLLSIDFTQSIYGNYGSGTELHLIGNLCYAYFENIPEIDNITISVDDAAYETGHMMYELGEKIPRDSAYQQG